jgi:hypothetical protein
MINIRLMGSISRRYFDTCVFFLFSIFLLIRKEIIWIRNVGSGLNVEQEKMVLVEDFVRYGWYDEGGIN